MIKVNEIARLKVTGEDVFVLGIEEAFVKVRRPVMTRDGIKHLIEHFSTQELATPEEFRTKELAERVAMQQQVLAAGGNADQVQTVQ